MSYHLIMTSAIEFKRIAQINIFHVAQPPMVTDTQFKSLFGVNAEICVPVYKFIRQRIDSNSNGEVESGYSTFAPVHLLWGLHLMKSYGTTRNLAKFMGTTTNSFMKWSLFAICQINCMKDRVVSIE